MKEIETARLVLRAWTKKDAQALFAYANNPEVGPPAGWKPHVNEAESLKIIETLFMNRDVWAIVCKESGKVIGSVGLEPDKRRPGLESREMGYSLAKEFWGKGMMTEAASAVIEYAFAELSLAILAVCTGPENKGSQRVIEKCGFIYEGTSRRSYRIYDGSIRDTKCYSLLKEEWHENR